MSGVVEEYHGSDQPGPNRPDSELIYANQIGDGAIIGDGDPAGGYPEPLGSRRELGGRVLLIATDVPGVIEEMRITGLLPRPELIQDQ